MSGEQVTLFHPDYDPRQSDLYDYEQEDTDA